MRTRSDDVVGSGGPPSPVRRSGRRSLHRSLAGEPYVGLDEEFEPRQPLVGEGSAVLASPEPDEVNESRRWRWLRRGRRKTVV